MKTIIEIYEEYRIMQNLRDHMLRVASVASLICDNMDVEVDKENIIKTCLLHDMGNIVKFKLESFPEYNAPEGLEYWQGVQKEFWDKYGTNDHHANIAIIKEIGVPERIIELADAIQFELYCDINTSPDFGVKIVQYADTRVDPFGVVSYEDRMAESRARYKNHPNALSAESWEKFQLCGADTEKQIFAKCKIKPEDITNESIAPIIEELKKFVIK